MKFITHQDIMDLNITPEEAYSWAEYVINNKDKMTLPTKISIRPEDKAGAFCNVMPCYLENLGGVKMVTRYPHRVPALDSQILLLDTSTGLTKAVVDANLITALRTGAVCVHSLLQFAVKDFSVICHFSSHRVLSLEAEYVIVLHIEVVTVVVLNEVFRFPVV